MTRVTNMEPTPICCGYAKKFICLTYEAYYLGKIDNFLKNKPFWIVRGTKLHPEEVGLPYPKECEIIWCPSCGQGLPDIKLKDPLPKKIMTIRDGGYYCNTYDERLHACTCSRPEEMWEII